MAASTMAGAVSPSGSPIANEMAPAGVCPRFFGRRDVSVIRATRLDAPTGCAGESGRDVMSGLSLSGEGLPPAAP